jgi:hypothetical protein
MFKGGSEQFSDEFYGFTIESNCPDFYCGSGNKLNTVLLIFSEKLRIFIAQEVAGFKRQNISMNDYSENIKNFKDSFLPA